MKRVICLVTLGLLVCSGSLSQQTLAWQDHHGNAITDVKEAGADYQIQGEYLGTSSDESTTVGAQIVARGDGKFAGRFYIGGLPGKGWDRDGEYIEVSGETNGDTTTLTRKDGDDGQAVIKDGIMQIFHEGNMVMEMNRVERKSPTLGKKAPEGATVLFDGTDADQFENGKLVDDEYLGASNCKSRKKFGDHSLHIEFRTPFMPGSQGQARGNSGVYVQGRYEVQVLDSFGLEGENNECGGIYSLGKPKVNMCLPPLTWQTYDIDFKAATMDDDGNRKPARITVKHNGVVIHEDVELTKGTPGGLPMGDAPESLFLQDHGNPVVFRNIWVMEK